MVKAGKAAVTKKRQLDCAVLQLGKTIQLGTYLGYRCSQAILDGLVVS